MNENKFDGFKPIDANYAQKNMENSENIKFFETIQKLEDYLVSLKDRNEISDKEYEKAKGILDSARK